jgi:hypothetical protein
VNIEIPARAGRNGIWYLLLGMMMGAALATAILGFGFPDSFRKVRSEVYNQVPALLFELRNQQGSLAFEEVSNLTTSKTMRASLVNLIELGDTSFAVVYPSQYALFVFQFRDGQWRCLGAPRGNTPAACAPENFVN